MCPLFASAFAARILARGSSSTRDSPKLSRCSGALLRDLFAFANPAREGAARQGGPSPGDPPGTPHGAIATVSRFFGQTTIL
mgnify:CR=1